MLGLSRDVGIWEPRRYSGQLSVASDRVVEDDIAAGITHSYRRSKRIRPSLFERMKRKMYLPISGRKVA